MSTFTCFARGSFQADVTKDQAWKAFTDAFLDLPVPGMPQVEWPEDRYPSVGAIHAQGNIQIQIVNWQPQRFFHYSILKSNCRLVSSFSVGISGRNGPPMFEASFQATGFLAKMNSFRVLRSMLGNDGLQATAYWGSWLQIPILRDKVRFAD